MEELINKINKKIEELKNDKIFLPKDQAFMSGSIYGMILALNIIQEASQQDVEASANTCTCVYPNDKCSCEFRDKYDTCHC